jgi:hypothetical protein
MVSGYQRQVRLVLGDVGRDNHTPFGREARSALLQQGGRR